MDIYGAPYIYKWERHSACRLTLYRDLDWRARSQLYIDQIQSIGPRPPRHEQMWSAPYPYRNLRAPPIFPIPIYIEGRGALCMHPDELYSEEHQPIEIYGISAGLKFYGLWVGV